ncbi:hypothetical protein GIB67_015022 [Kingdonia uniflora]|uniref:BRCA1-associated protein n=1 Tax=Kingdonia uniflora TaxID=39325 RepID=A0A7J7MU66_9MAGN|nr:hypothetical protein GIB67_015022 [Kingdonia uniflora]
MFALQIHSVDTNHSLTREDHATSNSSSTNPNIQERRGVVHLFHRNISSSSSFVSPNPNTTTAEESTTLIFVLAVPNHLLSDEFLRFCKSHLDHDHVVEILFIRNDEMEDRYSVLIRFVDLKKAQSFYRNYNGKRFSSTEVEVCHTLFTVSVEFTEFTEIAITPPLGFTELPTCPVCLERLDQDTSGILTTLCDHSFQCPCISKWTDLSCLVCQFYREKSEKPTCFVCGTLENLWICVICGFVGCGRYKERHAIKHWEDTQHSYSLDLETQQVWDYFGDQYVHRLNQSKTEGKSVDANSDCRSLNGDFGSYGCRKESGIVRNSKVNAIDDEYNQLIVTQLESQRQFFEAQMAEAEAKKESSISEALEKAVNLKLQEIQLKIEKCAEEKKTVAEINDSLMKNQELYRRKVKDIEERTKISLKARDETILDLEEQIRDLTIYVQAQKTVAKMTDSENIKGGTVLPVPLQQSSSANSKSRNKTNRRRN